MRKLLLIAVAVVFIVGGTVPVIASSSNLEYMDELDLIYEVGGSDAIWGSEHLDVGVMTGISNLGNPWNDEEVGSYAMVKADVKGIRLLNRILDFIFNK